MTSVFVFVLRTIILAAGLALGFGVTMSMEPDASWEGGAIMVCLFGSPLAAFCIAAGFGFAPNRWTSTGRTHHLAFRDGQTKAVWMIFVLLGWVFGAIAAVKAYNHSSHGEKQPVPGPRKQRVLDARGTPIGVGKAQEPSGQNAPAQVVGQRIDEPIAVFTCACGKKFGVKLTERTKGKSAACPACGVLVTVPHASQ